MVDEVQVMTEIKHKGNVTNCSRSFQYSCLSSLLVSVTDGLSTYVQEPLAIGRRGCTGRDLSEKTLATDNGR